jgi:hypothetical protein
VGHRHGADPAPVPERPTREARTMFFFFSNRLGCAGSLFLSAVVTVLLLLILWR